MYPVTDRQFDTPSYLVMSVKRYVQDVVYTVILNKCPEQPIIHQLAVRLRYIRGR